MNAAEDDEICSGDGITGEWLSSWYPETHVGLKMVIEAKRMDMKRFNRMEVYRVVTRKPMEKDEEEKMISIRWVITKKGTDEHLWHASSTPKTKPGELFAGTPGSGR